jgi:hypothetical protein
MTPTCRAIWSSTLPAGFADLVPLQKATMGHETARALTDERLRHRAYTRETGDDSPDVRNWTWYGFAVGFVILFYTLFLHKPLYFQFEPSLLRGSLKCTRNFSFLVQQKLVKKF